MMGGNIKVNLVGLGNYGETVVTTDSTIAQLYQHVVSAIGYPYLKLAVGGNVLANPAENIASACLAHGNDAVELTVVKLSGPDRLDGPDMDKFKASIDAAVERQGKVSWPFGLEHLQVLNLQGSPGWTMRLLNSIEQFTSFLAALQEMKSLTILDLTGNDLELEACQFKDIWSAANINPIKTFASALPPSLEVLKLSHSEDWMFTPFLEALGAGFDTHAMSNLHELYFTTWDGKPVYPDGRHISEPLGKCLRCLPSLQLLSLKDCRLWAENLPQIAGVLPASIKVFEFCFDSGEPESEDDDTVDAPSNVKLFLERTPPGLKRLILNAPHDARRSWPRWLAETISAHLPEGVALTCQGPHGLEWATGKDDVRGIKRSADDIKRFADDIS